MMKGQFPIRREFGQTCGLQLTGVYNRLEAEPNACVPEAQTF
jgi:hypothetical protein